MLTYGCLVWEGWWSVIRRRVLCEEVHKRLSSNSCVGRLLSRGCVLVAIGVCLFRIQVWVIGYYLLHTVEHGHASVEGLNAVMQLKACRKIFVSSPSCISIVGNTCHSMQKLNQEQGSSMIVFFFRGYSLSNWLAIPTPIAKSEDTQCAILEDEQKMLS